MDTISRISGFQKKLLVSIGGIFLFFAMCFSVWQYQREKEYKIALLHSRLQMYGYEMHQALGSQITNTTALERYAKTHEMADLRITVTDLQGKVKADTYDKDVMLFGNHLHRPEIKQAIREGSGYDNRRLSEETHETYFYSATRFGSTIVRLSVPYSAELTQMLEADKSYLWYVLAITLLISVVLYNNTLRIARHVIYLREFALEAEEGRELDHDLERELPDDELGEISHTIITLYWKLKHLEEEKQRIKRQLTQNAAHELKTPAMSIHGFLESMIEHPDMPEDKRRHFLQRCYAQSQRMNKLLQDMAMLTRLDERALPPSSDKEPPVKTDIAAVVNAVLQDTALQMEQKHMKAIVNLPAKVEVNAERELVYSIFRNLADNAIAYAGGATYLKITGRVTGTGSRPGYEFAVEDDGQGVALEHLPRIFERFYRVDKGRSRKMGGTGLGLAIVKNAVAACGGTCAAEPTPGGGLTIRFGIKS